MAHFLIQLLPGRPGFPETITKEEARTMEAHFKYLKGVFAEGKIVLVGRTTGPQRTIGIVVLEAASEKEARRIMGGDPAVNERVVKAELFLFRIALERN